MQYDDMTGVLMQRISPKYPVVSRPENRKTRTGGLRYIQIVAFVAAEWRSSAKHEGII